MTDFPSSLSDAVDAVSTERWTPEGLESETLEGVSQQRINAVVETRISASPHIDGPFAGVPVTIKEAIEVTGFHHTWGLLEHRSTIAQRDAPAVARLRRAGANIIGTTNVAEMLGDFGQTDNPVYGSTLNPWDLSRTPGGSSGGAAAAVAAGLSFLDLGTDVAGSIRIPAAMCGVVGLKPTPGLVPTGFHPPGADDVRTDLDFLAALGPITRTATDIRLALDVLSDRHAPSLLPVSGLRVGVLTRGGGAYPEDSILAAIDGAARTLTSDGIAVRHVEPGPVDFTISGSLFAEALDLYFTAKSGHADAGRIRDLLTRRKVVIAQWSTLFDEVDALIMPVTPVTAPPHDLRPSSERSLTIRGSQHPYAALASWTRHATIAGLPALSVPVALDPGRLPIGLQLVGPPDSDGSLIDLAIRLAELGHTIPLADYPDGTSVAMPRYPSGGHMSER